jgi:hypothetical protein
MSSSAVFQFTRIIAKDFRFWICLFFVFRLYGINQPPIESGHSWRQTFTCMVARNFLEQDPNILLPRTDLSGTRPDVVACEFPLFNYLIFIVAKIFGYQHWYGRLINLAISSLGIYMFYLIVRQYFGNRTAVFAGIIFLSSSWFVFSRKIMPDTFSVSLVLIGLFFLVKYLKNGKWHSLLLFFIFGALGGLCKIPAMIILSLSLIAVIDPKIDRNKRLMTFAALSAASLAVFAWYFAWEPFLLHKYRNQLYFPRGIIQGINELCHLWRGTIDKFTFVSLRSYISLIFFGTGVYFMIKKRVFLLMKILAISVPVLIYFMIKSGYVFATHNYYIIPFVPVMALIAGYGLSSVTWIKTAGFIIVLIMIEGVANQIHDFRFNQSEAYFIDLEKIADKVSARTDRIAITGGLNPQEMYFAHRKGWGLESQDLKNSAFLQELQANGCRLVFVNKRGINFSLDFPVIYDDQHYVIYRLE